MSITTKGILLAIASGMLWGLGSNCAQFLLQFRSVDASWLVTARLISAGVIALILSQCLYGTSIWNVYKSRTGMRDLMIFALLGLAVCQYTFFLTIRLSNAGTATVLQYTGPAMIIIYIALRKHRIPARSDVLCIFLALMGTILLATHGQIGTLALSSTTLEWGLISAAMLAVYTVQPVELLRQYGTLPILGHAMLLGGLAMAIVFPLYPITGTWNMTALLALSFIVLGGTIGAYFCYMIGVRCIGPARGSICSSVEPVAAAVCAAAVLGTTFVLMDIIGFICIISTVFLIAKASR